MDAILVPVATFLTITTLYYGFWTVFVAPLIQDVFAIVGMVITFFLPAQREESEPKAPAKKKESKETLSDLHPHPDWN